MQQVVIKLVMYCVWIKGKPHAFVDSERLESGYLEGRDQALEFLEGREPRLSNFLGNYCIININLYFGISFYQLSNFLRNYCIININLYLVSVSITFIPIQAIFLCPSF